MTPADKLRAYVDMVRVDGAMGPAVVDLILRDVIKPVARDAHLAGKDFSSEHIAELYALNLIREMGATDVPDR